MKVAAVSATAARFKISRIFRFLHSGAGAPLSFFGEPCDGSYTLLASRIKQLSPMSLQRIVIFAALLFFLGGCAGTRILKKRDLSSVQVGVAVTSSKVLRKPTYILPVAKGRDKGAQLYVYEWDKPGDEINNRMYTYVVVREGRVARIFEDPADKYEKDALAASYAFMDSEGERKLKSDADRRTATGALRTLAEGVAIAGSFIPVAGPAIAMAGQAAGLTTQAVTANQSEESPVFQPMPARPAYLTTVPPETSSRKD